MRLTLLLFFVLLSAGCMRGEEAPTSSEEASVAGGTDASEATDVGVQVPANGTNGSYVSGYYRADFMLGLCVEPEAACLRPRMVETRVEFTIRSEEVQEVRDGGSWVLKANWTPTGAGSENVILRLLHLPDGQLVLHHEGTSPMELNLPSDTFQGGHEYTVEFIPATGGVFLNQHVTYTIDPLPKDGP